METEREGDGERDRERTPIFDTNVFEQLNTSGRLEYSERQRTLFELISQV